MRVVLALVLGVLAVVGANVEVGSAYDYHERVGILEAQRIKAGEDELLQPSDGRIVGGAASSVTAQPFLAGLVINLVNIAGNSVCGSSLLSHNRLLTAAHCWFDGRNQAWQFTVVLGSQFLFSGGIRISTSQVVMHPQWTPSLLANDVAVIYLPTSVPFSSEVQPIALPSGSQTWEQFTGEWAIAAGYGKTNDRSGPRSQGPIIDFLLRTVHTSRLKQLGVSTGTFRSQVWLQVISVAECQASFGTWARDSNVCTSGRGGVGICGGDSGGPLYVIRNGQPILVRTHIPYCISYPPVASSTWQLEYVLSYFVLNDPAVDPVLVPVNATPCLAFNSDTATAHDSDLCEDRTNASIKTKYSLYYLIGASSFVAAAGCQLGHPSAFARVTSFQSWIQQNLWHLMTIDQRRTNRGAEGAARPGPPVLGGPQMPPRSPDQILNKTLKMCLTFSNRWKNVLDIALCRAQGYDNAASMSGVHRGVQRKIREVNPKALFSSYSNHSVNLCGVHAFACVPSSVTCFGTVEKLYSFFSSSTQKWPLLKEKTGKNLKRLSDTS
ncbi:Chymotrypsin-1 [Eumeta japonica]|uniref:Chymotrypsin-1 n=1 Tax=Eumeta variegata TaxID=151549 RepID=A0A4C1U843_EUMVA|nr:Chymotrypsin-1 [Eumeta japonica]